LLALVFNKLGWKDFKLFAFGKNQGKNDEGKPGICHGLTKAGGKNFRKAV